MIQLIAFKKFTQLIKSPVYSGFLLFFLFSGCNLLDQKVTSKPVVKVNQYQLSVKDFSNHLARKIKNLDALSAKDTYNLNRTKEEIVKTFIIESLVQSWAQENKVSIKEESIKQEVEKLRAIYPDDFAFRNFLSTENLSFADWKKSVEYSLLEKELFRTLNLKSKSITDDELKKYYEEHKEEFRLKERILIRQILVDEEAKLDRLKIDVKKIDFSALAKDYSISPEGKNGGLLDWIEKGTVDYFDQLFTQPVGSIKSLQSPFGFHLIKIEKKSPSSLKSFDEVKNKIARRFVANNEQSLYLAWLDVELRKAKIFKDSELINSISIETKGKNE